MAQDYIYERRGYEPNWWKFLAWYIFIMVLGTIIIYGYFEII
jgi:hypothetical protein